MPNTNITIHPRAIVHPNAQIGVGTSIGADAIVDEFVEIGDRCEIRARAIATGHTKIDMTTKLATGRSLAQSRKIIHTKARLVLSKSAIAMCCANM